MDAFETTPLDGMALSGQDPLMGSVWHNAALDGNAGLTGALDTIRSTANRGAFTPELEPLSTSADKEPDAPPITPLSHSASASDLNDLSLIQPIVPRSIATGVADKAETANGDDGTAAADPLTGIAEGAALVGSDDSDFLIKDVASVNNEVVLDLETAEPTSFRENVVAIARQEWEYFEQGALSENDPLASQRIEEYFQSFGEDYTGQYWSAAFISWVMGEAGAGDQFNYSQLHADYLNQAIEDKESGSDAAFIGHKTDEYSLQVGDLIGANREGEEEGEITVTYDTAPDYSYYSHADIVVATRPGEIDVIGGNVGDSVSLKTYTVDPEGRITNPDDGDASDDFFVVIENRFGENDSAPDPSTPPYQDYIVHEGTPIGVNPTGNEFLTGDYDGDGRSDLFQVVTEGTGTNSTEVHVLSGASNYQDYIVHEGTPIGVNPQATEFLTGDYDGDGRSDLFGIVTDGTGTNSTEVHVLSGASNYQDYVVHMGTPIGINPGATEFLTGDYDGDGRSDLFGIVTDGTGTNSTEVHVLSGASNYQDYVVHMGTPIGINPGATEFLTGDYDGDGRSDLFGIVTDGTGTNSTEVHVLSDGINDVSDTPPSTEPPAPPGGIEYGDYDPVAAAPKFVTEEFLSEVFAISERLDMVPEYLMAVMGHETGDETPYNPAAESPSGAIGLIQIMPENAIAMGTSAEELAAMETAVEQLPYVEQWFSDPEFSVDFSSLEDKTLEDTYLAVFAPNRIGEDEVYSAESDPTEYEANQGLDENGDGVITAEETTANVRRFLPGQELFAGYRDMPIA